MVTTPKCEITIGYSIYSGLYQNNPPLLLFQSTVFGVYVLLPPLPLC